MVGPTLSTDRLAQLTLKHLRELRRVRETVERLESRAEWLTDWEAEQRKLQILNRLTSHMESTTPASFRDMSHHVTELKGYLQAVHDADTLADSRLQELATEHAVLYIAKLSERLQDAVRRAELNASGVYELAVSALHMFSQRRGAASLLASGGAIAALVRALSPVNPTPVIVSAAAAAGNLADDAHCRFLFRSGGGVGALVRLLQADCTRSMQIAAAASLALLSARDGSIQDSVRYLGGIDYLTDMLASLHPDAEEVARCCLHSLRHNNARNQEDIVRAVKRHPALARDLEKLQATSDKIAFEEALLKKTAAFEEALQRTSAPASPPPKLADSYSYTPVKAKLASSWQFESQDEDAGGWKIPAVRTRPASAGASLAPSQPSSPIRAKALHPEDGKHITRFSVDEVCALMSELSFDRLDVKMARSLGITGVDFMDLSEQDMRIELAMSTLKVNKVKRVQESVRLFDTIASSQRQGSVSDVELRLFLAGHGCTATESSKVIRLLRNLIGTASTPAGFLSREDAVTLWEWVLGYEWVLHAFKIYGINV